jgi:hypothetical protein
MRKHPFLLTVLLTLFMAHGTLTDAADPSDARAAREREMLHRAQEALRQSQSDNGVLSEQKAAAEEKLKQATSELDAIRGSSKSQRAALRAQEEKAAAVQMDLTRQLEEARKQLATLTAQKSEVTSQLQAETAQLQAARQELETGKAANASCEAKNLKLYEYSMELAQHYAKKGVWASLRQEEPVFGLKEVSMQNLLQEYEQKLAQQRVTKSTGN